MVNKQSYHPYCPTSCKVRQPDNETEILRNIFLFKRYTENKSERLVPDAFLFNKKIKMK